MSKVYTTSVVIIPPESKWEPIQEIRRVYDRQIDRWMPHINLLYPFHPKEEFDNLEKVFSNYCKNIEPFEITLKEIHYFAHQHQNFTLWFIPSPAGVIIDLQKELLKLVPDCNDVNRYEKGFSPHLSIGQIKGKENMEKIKTQLQKSWKPLCFLVDKIHFIWRDKVKKTPFKIERTILLKKD